MSRPYDESQRVTLEITAPLRHEDGALAEWCRHRRCESRPVGVIDSPFNFPRAYCETHLGLEVAIQVDLAFEQRWDRDLIGLTAQIEAEGFGDIDDLPACEECGEHPDVHCSCGVAWCARHVGRGTFCTRCGRTWTLQPSSMVSTSSSAGDGESASGPVSGGLVLSTPPAGPTLLGAVS